MNHGFQLLTPARQKMFFRGIQSRFQRGESQAETLQQEQAAEKLRLDAQLVSNQTETSADCSAQRKRFLETWDQVDERSIADYEHQTLQARNDKSRELSIVRRDRKQANADQEQTYDGQLTKVHERYKIEKPKILAQQKLENDRLDSLHAKSTQIVQSSRELVIHRLGGPEKLTALMPDDSSLQWFDPANPPDLKTCVEEINSRIKRASEVRAELDKIPGLGFVESYYLTFVIAVVAAIWCAVVYLIGPSPLMLWMLGAIPLAGIAGLATHTYFSIPVRKRTKELHPQIEAFNTENEKITAFARRFSTDKASTNLGKLRTYRSAELERLRAEHEQKMLDLKQTFKDREDSLLKLYDDRLVSIETDFTRSFVTSSKEMKLRGDSEANSISARLQENLQRSEKQRNELLLKHQQDLNRLQLKFQHAIRRSLQRAEQTNAEIASHFPDWKTVCDSLSSGRANGETLRWLPLGELEIHGQDIPAAVTEAPSVDALPLTLTRETQAGLIIDCPGNQMDAAANWVRAILWKVLTAVTPGRCRLTLLDPVGRGQNFASLVGLGDLDPLLINHRAWSATNQIAARLAELTQHVEDVLQTCLRDRYATIEDFNRDAGPLAEPYHIVAAVGVPAGLSRDSIDSIRALTDSGRRCGVFTILVRDTSQEWPTEVPPLPESYMLRLRIDEQGNAVHCEPGLEGRSIIPSEPPPSEAIPLLTEQIGRGSLTAQRVEIPLLDLVPSKDHDSFDSAEGLSIPIGRQGVGRSLALELGSGMRQHILVAGKTGSGKSTMLHAMIMASALRYSPDQLHLYLLDFKKGVEFKIYADQVLPHARVIGIESEREFGRSVLAKLDEELQRRGELFREAGVQEVAEFRKLGKTLPRILLVVDEFQELFTRDDRIAQECTMLLDRLVRQGRSFGMHVVLSSQSLAGAYTLPRATLGQMAVRVALQCSEADASMILSDENTAARLLTRPGEAIFNDAGGLVEGNQPFQVAWIDSDLQREQLIAIAAKHQAALAEYGRPLVFEGNRHSIWSEEVASAVIADNTGTHKALGLLGEAVRIGPPTTLKLTDQTGRNVLCVADSSSIESVLATWLPTAVAEVRSRLGAAPEIVYFEGRRNEGAEFSLSKWLTEVGIIDRVIHPRDCLVEINRLMAMLTARNDSPDEYPPVFVVIAELERFRDLRQDESFGFSLDSSETVSGGASLQKLLSDGPPVGIHVVITCNSSETLFRWLPRTSQHDLELRIVGRISANDSAQLIDTPEASSLAPASMYMYDDADGRLEKFRLCEIPEVQRVKKWLGNW